VAPSSLVALPTEVAIEIAGHLAATLERPMDDLHSLRETCLFMRRVCSDRAVGRRVALDRFKHAMLWNKPARYAILPTRLTQVGNPKASFLTEMRVIFGETCSPQPCLDDLTRAATGEHNVVAYLVALFLYMNNGGVGDDDTTRWYVRRVEGEEQSVASGDSKPTKMRMLSNKGCQLCHEQTAKVVHQTTWRKGGELLPPTLVHGDILCTGSSCGVTKGWPQITLFCSKDCRIHREIVLFQREIGIYN
uniref:F-box domain-containing protein n=1 Tax=Setaria italica TaxID=4555 RepID=K3YZK0_SETIT